MTIRLATRRALLALLLTLLALTGLQVATASPASACLTTGEGAGTWHNIDVDTRALTRVVIAHCVPRTTCNGDICSRTYGTTTNPFGACSPTDCDWGAEFATSGGDGWNVSVHDFGFKTSRVWVRNYDFHGRTYLRVYTWNDFASSSRTDYSTDDWFLK